MKTHIRAIPEFNNGGIEVPVCNRRIGGGRRYTFVPKDEATCEKCRRLYPKLYPWAVTETSPSPEERLRNGRVIVMRQSELSAECWLVQMQGLSACDTCQHKNSRECGGKNIRKTGKNELGIKIPKERA